MSRKDDEKLVPLFGRANDDRSRLFISALRDAADKIRGSDSYKTNNIVLDPAYTAITCAITGNIYLSKITDNFKNKFFDPKTIGVDDDDINQEWIGYFFDFLYRVTKLRITKAQSTKSKTDQELHDSILNIIETASGPAQGGTELEFTQELIKTLISEGKSKDPITGTTANIDMKSPSTWKNLTEVTYHVADDILTSLILADDTTYFNTNIYRSFNTVTTVKKDQVISKKSEFVNVYINILNNVRSVKKDTGKTKFNYNFNKYWLQTQLDAYVADASKPINNTSSFLDNEPTAVVEQYFNKDGHLYMKDSNGSLVQVDIKSQAYKDLYKTTKCIGTGFDEDITKNPKETCTRYLQDCLKGKDISKCKEFLEKPDFWNNAEKEVNAMLPPVAVHTLQAFEFEFYSSFDKDANATLIKVCTTQKWIENLLNFTKSTPPKLVQKDIEAIAKNSKLIGYLNMLVTKINSNPAILNKNYTGPIISQINNPNPDAFKNTKLYKYGVRPRISVPTLSLSSLDKLRNAVNQNYSGILLRLGFPGSSRMHGFNLGLVGGGNQSIIEVFQNKISDETQNIGSIIEQHHVTLSERLKHLGKEISKTDEDKIVALIKTLKDSESKLNKASLYTEKYAQLLERYGQKDNTSILSINHLTEFVDNRNKYFERVNKKQNDLISIMKSIIEAVNNEYQKSSKPQSMTIVDPATINSLLG